MKNDSNDYGDADVSDNYNNYNKIVSNGPTRLI